MLFSKEVGFRSVTGMFLVVFTVFGFYITSTAALNAGLRLSPIVEPGGVELVLEVDQVGPEDQVEIQVATELGTPETLSFQTRSRGSLGQRSFRLPLPSEGNAYFRALLESHHSSGEVPWLLEVPGLISGVHFQQPLILAPEARLWLADSWIPAGSVLRLSRSDNAPSEMEWHLRTPSPFSLDSNGRLKLGQTEVGILTTTPRSLRLECRSRIAASDLQELVRGIGIISTHVQSGTEFQIWNWELDSGLPGTKSLVHETVERASDCQMLSQGMMIIDRTGSLSAVDFQRLQSAAMGLIDGAEEVSNQRQWAVASFCDTAFLHQPLTSDRDALRRSIASLTQNTPVGEMPCAFTDVAAGIRESTRVLTNTSSIRFVVLMTDGQNTRDPGAPVSLDQETLDAAQEARAAGIRIFVYGIGENRNDSLLRQIATQPEDFFDAHELDLLPALLAQIPRRVCGDSLMPPELETGGDQWVWIPEAATLSGSCPDCPEGTRARWFLEDGPGAIRWLEHGDWKSLVQFYRPGDYRFRLSVGTGDRILFRGTIVRVRQSNQPPVVTIETPRQVGLGRWVLSAQVQDDGLGSDGLTNSNPFRVQWSLIEGPSVVSVVDPESLVTEIRDLVPGRYVWKLTVTDSGGLRQTGQTILDVPTNTGWEIFLDAGYTSSAVGGLRGSGSGVLTLRGVRGPVRKAFLLWHGPTDSDAPWINSQVQFQKHWVSGESLGISHADEWSFGNQHPYANAQSYRADVTPWVVGDGDYTIDHLWKTDEINVNGASLMVVYEEPDSSRRLDIRLWMGNESNGNFAPSLDGPALAASIQQDGRLWVGGHFSMVGGRRYSNLVRLRPDGETDWTYEQNQTSAQVDEMHALACRSDGGCFCVGSAVRPSGDRVSTLWSVNASGSDDLGFTPVTFSGDEIRCSMVESNALWIGGSFGLWQLDLRGHVVRKIAHGFDVFALVSLGGGGIAIGGTRLETTSQDASLRSNGFVARVRSDFELQALSVSFDGPVLAMAVSPDGDWFVGGSFQQVNSLHRPGVVKLDLQGQFREGWSPELWTSNSTVEVRSFWIPSEAPSAAEGASDRIVLGGRMSLDLNGVHSAVGLLTLDRERGEIVDFERLTLRDSERGVYQLVADGDDGGFWVVGDFRTLDYVNRVHLSRGGEVIRGNTGDRGWSLPLEWEQPMGLSEAEVELHVSDGQACSDCDSDLAAWFLDPDLLLDDTVWIQPSEQTICGRIQNQLFAGVSASPAQDPCVHNLGLWDLLRFPLPVSSDGSAVHSTLRTRFTDPESTEDFVTLVGLAVLSPSQKTLSAPLATNQWNLAGDSFEVERRAGPQRLMVLQNDHLPQTARIVACSSAEYGVCIVTPEGSALLYIPSSKNAPEPRSELLSYTVDCGKGVLLTGHVRLTVTGWGPVLLSDQNQVLHETLDATSSPTRGPGHGSKMLLLHTKGREWLTLSATSADFGIHLYLRDASGQYLNSATHSWREDEEVLELEEIRLSQELPEAGDYWVEIASHGQTTEGVFDLQIHHDFGSEIPLRIWIEDIFASESLDLGSLPRLGRAISVRVENLSSVSVSDVRFTLFPWAGSSRSIEMTPDTPVEIDGGGSRGFVCLLGEQEDASSDEAPSLYRWSLSVSGFEIQGGTLSFVNEWQVPMLSLRAVPQSSGWMLEAIPLTSVSEIDAPTGFIFDSSQGQRVVSSENHWVAVDLPLPDSTGVQVWATNQWGRSQHVSLDSMQPQQIRAVALDDVFSFPPQSNPQILDVLKNDLGLSRVARVESPVLGSVEVNSQGELIYSPFLDSKGVDRFAYQAMDIEGKLHSAQVQVHLEEPRIRITSPSPGDRIDYGNPVTLTASVDTAITRALMVRFRVGGEIVGSIFRAPYEFVWEPSSRGAFSVVAEALGLDGHWNVSRSVELIVQNAAEIPPRVKIESPASGDVIREGSLQVLGTVQFDGCPNPMLEMELIDTHGLTVARKSASGNRERSELGVLDLSVLQNGVYTLQLRASGCGHEGMDAVRFVLESQVKIGAFTWTETDLQLPTSGMPIVIARHYDSLNPKGGDFGPGWTLELFDLQVELDEDRMSVQDPDTEEVYSVRSGGDRNITLTLPNSGLRTTFQFGLDPGPDEGGIPCFCFIASWKSDPRFASSHLSATGIRELRFVPFQQTLPPFWLDAGPETPLENYDFHGWVLTNVDGTIYEIQRPFLGRANLESQGEWLQYADTYGAPVLAAIQSPHGDRLEWHRDVPVRIEHRDASGHKTRSIVFDYGADGFVHSIFDAQALGSDGKPKPGEPPVLMYEYDPTTSNLVSVAQLTNRSQKQYARHSYQYQDARWPHLLTSKVDSRGVVSLAMAYDPEGRCVSMTNPNRGGSQFAHDLENRRETIVDMDGGVTVHDYDAHGNVVQSVDPLGRITKRSFDEQGRLLSETNHVGTSGEQWVQKQYDALGRITLLVEDALTNRFAYDAQGHWIFHQDPLGVTRSNVYDPNGLLTEVQIQGEGSTLVTRLAYDASGRVVETVDALGRRTHLNYDSNGNVAETILQGTGGEVLSSIQQTFDENGNVLSRTECLDLGTGVCEPIRYSYEYDSMNRVQLTVDPLGGQTETQYDSEGHSIKEIDPLGRETTFDYDLLGNLIQTRLPFDSHLGQIVLRNVYDTQGRLLYSQHACALEATAHPLNGVTIAAGEYREYDRWGRLVRSGRCAPFGIQVSTNEQGIPVSEIVELPEKVSVEENHYDAAGRLDWVRDVSGRINARVFDAASRQIGTTNALGTAAESVTRTEFDNAGLVVRQVDPLGFSTAFSNDAFGRKVSTRFPAVNEEASVSSTGYDELGRVVAETNEIGIVTRFGYDAFNRLIEVTNAFGTESETITRYVRNARGDVLEQIDAGGRSTRYVYDALGRRLERQLPSGDMERCVYDLVGNLLVRTQYNGRILVQSFDSQNRLIQKAERGTTGEEIPLAFFQYTPAGKRQSQWDVSGWTYYRYDDWDRMIRKEKPGWGTLQYDYLPDDHVERTRITTEDASWEMDYSYDPLGRLASVRIPEFDTGVEYAYDRSGRLTQTQYPKGVGNECHYDSRGRLQRMSWNQGDRSVASFDYLTSAANQRTQLVESVFSPTPTSRIYTWDYDALGRLQSESISDLGKAKYRYDRVGNRLSRESTILSLPSTEARYDANDRQDSDQDPGNSNADYDGSGNRIRGVGLHGNYQDEYDVENRLIRRRWIPSKPTN